MKQLIAPIALIVALIAIFVIVDRNEFSRHDDQKFIHPPSPPNKTTASVSQTKPVTEVKPTVEAKNVEAKPVAGTKTVNNPQSATESKKPAEAKPVAEMKTDKPIQTKSVAETRPEEIAKPAAVPRVTAEEAKQENEKSIKYWKARQNIRIEEDKRGIPYYRERFFKIEAAYNRETYPNRLIIQTDTWKLVHDESITDESIATKNENCFKVKSDIPLEYRFIQPLLEHSMYCYTISCIAEGNGTISFYSDASNKTETFIVNTDDPTVFFFELGEANTLNTKITPAFRIQGDLQIEAVTIYKEQKYDDRTVCLGRIEEISSVPDIEKANYPDCFYTAKFVASQILDGEPVPQNLQLLIPAFRNNKIDPLSRLIKKGSWRVAIKAFSSASKNEQEIEQVDEIDSFLFAPYILIDAAPDSAEKGTDSTPFLDGNKYMSPYNSILNPCIKQYDDDSKLAIKNEIAKVNRVLESLDDEIETINQSFQLSWDKKQQQYDVLIPTRIWAQENDSFFTLPTKWDFVHPQKMKESNLNAIKELNDLLKHNNIQFIVQVVPDLYDIAALVLNSDFKKYGDQQCAVVVKQLLENGIETQYLSDSFVENAFNYERLFFYPYDNHPGEGAADIMTEHAANRLNLFGDAFPKEYDKTLFSTEYHDTGAGDNLKWPSNCHIGQHKAGTTVQTPHIYYNNKEIASDSTSKILLLGNSFTQEPFREAYLSYLTSKILYKVHGRTMNGASLLTSLPNILLLNFEKYLKGKLVVILPVSISTLINDDYTFFNVKDADSLYAKTETGELVFSFSPRNNSPSIPIIPSSYTFNSFFQSFLANNTGVVSLSANNPEITMDIPSDENVNTIVLSVAPWRDVKVTLSVNGVKNVPATAFNPAWQIITCPLSSESKTISIRLDLNDCSPNAGVFIGRISGYK